jgi:hypothetical protein
MYDFLIQRVYHTLKKIHILHQFTFLGAFAQSHKVPITFIMSVCLSTCIGAAPTWLISVIFNITYFYENVSRKSKFRLNRADIFKHFSWKPKYLFFSATLYHHQNRSVPVKLYQANRIADEVYISSECTRMLRYTYSASLVLFYGSVYFWLLAYSGSRLKKFEENWSSNEGFHTECVISFSVSDWISVRLSV